jgi:acetylornithine deacetylase
VSPAVSNAPSVRHLKDYIAIPSVNPMGREDIPPEVAGERRYAEYLRDQLRGMRIDAELVGRGERRSVVARVTSAEARETVLVASHLDTVPVDNMKISPFDPTLKAGRLYGRGSCDTKGGMAALVAALERVLSRGRLRRNLVLVGEADEEFTSIGVADVVAHLGDGLPDWILATEPTELRLATHHKGIVHARLAARGRACHASMPEAGENAIVALSRVVLALDELAAEISTRNDPLLGNATLSIGEIRGGQSPNIVPDRAWLSLDRRLLPEEDAELVRRELEETLERTGIANLSVEACIEAKPPLTTAADSAAVGACTASLTFCGLASEPVGVAFGTDAGVFARHGIPGVVMGPGSIAQAHTDSEFVETQQVEAMTDFFAHLLGG